LSGVRGYTVTVYHRDDDRRVRESRIEIDIKLL